MGSQRENAHVQDTNREVGRDIGSGRPIMEKQKGANPLPPPVDEEELAASDRRWQTFSWHQGQMLDASPAEREDLNAYVASVEQEKMEMYRSAGRKLIMGYNDKCFNISDVRMMQSVLVLPFNCFLWNVKYVNEMTPESLVVLELFHPRPNVLLIGHNEHIAEIPPATAEYIKSLGMNYELMSVASATSTFNILTQDGRDACCALITSEELKVEVPKELLPKEKILAHSRKPLEHMYPGTG